MVENPCKKVIDVRWIYKLKLKLDCEIVEYKSRFVVKGFLQRPEVDYNEVYAPVARLETIILVVVITTYKGWKMHQLDVKSTFLNGSLEKEVYVKQSPDFEVKGQEKMVYRLRNALYRFT